MIDLTKTAEDIAVDLVHTNKIIIDTLSSKQYDPTNDIELTEMAVTLAIETAKCMCSVSPNNNFRINNESGWQDITPKLQRVLEILNQMKI